MAALDWNIRGGDFADIGMLRRIQPFGGRLGSEHLKCRT